jgi:hypothetical protein
MSRIRVGPFPAGLIDKPLATTADLSGLRARGFRSWYQRSRYSVGKGKRLRVQGIISPTSTLNGADAICSAPFQQILRGPYDVAVGNRKIALAHGVDSKAELRL